MPDWSSPEEIAKEAGIFVKLMHALLGLYAYEWFISLDFEWDFLTGKKKFKWPMIFYFANRYLLLFALIGIAISFDTTSKLDCQPLYVFNQLAGDAAIGLASINLSIRTMAVWNFNRYIVGALVLLMLGHWSLILQGVQLHATWVDGVGCQIISTNNGILAAIFIYSMCFDLTVLMLNVYKLTNVVPTKASAGSAGRSRLVQLVFTDGLIFFFVAFMANLIATVFMLIDLNSIMSVIFNVPAAVASSIVACRAVRRLTNFTNSAAEVYAVSSSHNRGVLSSNRIPAVNFTSTKKSGVHVQMETFTHTQADQQQNGPGMYTKSQKEESETDFEDQDVEAKGQL